MRLDSAHITNFKLLEDVSLQFSADSSRPLTVIRAENGSGKTSILQALRWAMWGEQGIPDQMPLTSTAVLEGRGVTVQVRVDFSEKDIFSSEETRYRLIRSCIETRGTGDEFQRTGERERLLRLTDKGSEEIEEGRTARIRAMLPLNLSDVFFTDGDAVQNFVAGIDQSREDRQEYVHSAIRQLLGFEEVELAEKQLGTVSRRFRRELRGSGSEQLRVAEDQLEEVESALENKKAERDQIVHRSDAVDQQIHDDERELDRIKGIGDLEVIQDRIRQLSFDLEHVEGEEDHVRQQMKELLQSEELSTSILTDKLRRGADVLVELEDRRIIPGMSVGLLYDRLELGICICGSKLQEGSPQHAHLEDLIAHQQETEPNLERLTQLRYAARSIGLSSDTHESIRQKRQLLSAQFTECKDRQRNKTADLKVERDRRDQIDEQRVQELTQRLQSNRSKKSEFDRRRGDLEGRIDELEVQLSQQQEEVAKAERQEQLSTALRRKSQLANDLHSLTVGILDRLKSDHVGRVSDRMNRLFLDIVGADTTADANLFSGVDIVSGTYDVVVHAQEGRTLDVVTDLNGASKRALTLSLIWALMEVAEKQAPRIIDTPLGMTSGSVKHRLVELLTAPVDQGGLPYQVVLFMTRSEIRDIEDLIEDRAGVVTTLTCSKDYPRDLVNDWGTSYPVVRTCDCDHLHVCDLCERRNDRGILQHREVAD